MTNMEELFKDLISLGMHPKEKADTVTVMENLGHFLDEENEILYDKFKELGNSKQEITPLIAEHLDIAHLLKRASKKWDGGYTIAGLFGHGDAFVLRDPSFFRSSYYFMFSVFVVCTSSFPPI